MERNTNPEWVTGFFEHLGEDWQLAVILLTNVLGSRFAWKFADREHIIQASEGFRTMFAREALLQRGLPVTADDFGAEEN